MVEGRAGPGAGATPWDPESGEDGGGYDAAIGPALAAELYGGHLLERGIEDHHRNFTRFLMVARAGEGESGTATAEASTAYEGDEAPSLKTSVAFTLPHRPGSLHAALGVLTDHRIDLTRLESRPIPGRPWEYRFFADLRGGGPGARERALEELGGMAAELHVLGTYPEVEAP